MSFMGGNSIINVSIPNKNVLYASYMPFVTDGGIFVRSQRKHSLGDEVFLLIDLLDEEEKLPVTGKVVWISPANQGNRVKGVGIQFSTSDSAPIREKISKYLAGLLEGNTQPTFTM
ncbi:pilus assembly protein PilZ [Gammaproteobacteria bacterium ESL0073]|uniref:Pilus assembly protein PilZ n=1 Tax=Entomomonas moraniae TaxID=2213226 RepID=A0A3Q9JIS9_9GAMM|nr:PilZ domain-containing protein [Entomomonas moraniae]AWM79820.1 pilus assembly protein PilZ [Gammaproteobacteria bacterium ESL0073]AZS50525.1 pilus assembly protein PilZ [Entomomonas moraniae]